MGDELRNPGTYGLTAAGAGDSLADAERWLDATLAGRPIPPLLLVIGLGDGHLLDVLERRAPGTRVLALEPEPARARTFLARARWEAWLATGRLVYLVDPEYAGSERAWKIFSGIEGHLLLTHPDLVPDREGPVRAARTLKNIVFGVRANADARRRFAPRYLVNSLRNIPAMLRGSDVRALTDAYRGVPAVITAAGPSLDAAVADLRDARDRALIIATDTSLRPLLHAGITPPLVVALDPSPANARHFFSLPECRDTWLVSESALDRRATAVFGDRVFWFRAGEHQPWPFLNELGIQAELLEVWGSVLTGAFQVASLAGCDPIIVAGADLAFTGGRPYARGTTYEFDWAWAAARGTSLEDSWREQVQRHDPQEVMDVGGAPVTTTAALLSFRDWMVVRAQASGRRVINATGAGLFFGPGIEQLTIAAALPHRIAVPPVAPHARRSQTGRPSAVAARLRSLQATVRTGDCSAPPIPAWTAFSGEGFDRDAVAAALEEAAHTVETKRGLPAPPGVIPWDRLQACTGAAGLQTRIPEHAARYRALLQGTASHAVEGSTAGRAQLLAAAFDLLSPLVRELLRGEELVPALDPARLAEIPISTAYHLPDHLRWAMQVFEALLGIASGPFPPIRAVPFFHHPVSPRDVPAGGRTAARALPPHAASASLHATLQLLRCAATFAPGTRSGDMIARLAAIASAPLQGTTVMRGRPATLLVERGSSVLEIPLGIDETRLTRILSGTMSGSDNGDILLGCTGDRDSISVSITFRTEGRRRHAPGLLLPVWPRSLTDERVHGGIASYPVPAGAVCVTPDTHDSVVVRENGSIEPHLSWPRPVTCELPLGEAGAVAWSWGELGEPDGIQPYVMYRTSRDAEVTTEPLPFRPSRGIWWRGRLYWTCVPLGLGSWAPGEQARFVLPDLSLAHVQPADDELVLVPRVRGADGRIERRLLTEGWAWREDGATRTVPLGDHGVASCTSESHGWTATAHLEADRVQLRSSGGRSLSLVCYQPLRAVWAGRTLLVCTPSHELILFEDLIGALDGDRAPARPA